MRFFRKTSLYLSLFLYFFLYESSMAANTIRRGESLRDGINHKPLVSPQKTFELGFFSPGSSTHRFLGIWYGNIEDKAVVWVANRATPISDQSGVLMISNDGNLVLLDGKNITVWSSNIESSTTNNNNRVVSIHDTGNFVLSETDTDRPIWESFNHPTDTFLPQMRVRVNPQTGDNHAFVSWRSETDPSPGNYSLGVDPSGAPEIVLWEGNKTRKWRSGQWNSAIFTGIPNMSLLTNYLYGFKLSSPPDETVSVYFTYVPSDPSVLLRFKVLYNGTEEELRWNETLKKWTKFQSEPDSECDQYNRCGKFGICDMKGSNGICSCIHGYEQVSVGNWSRGCRRRTPLKCERNISVGEDEFLTLKSVKLPDFEIPEHNLVDPEDCRERCLRNCSCNAYSLVGGIGCMIWNQDLVDLQQFEAGGSSLHIRLADSEVGENRKTKIAVIVAVLVGVILIGIFALLLWRFKRKKDVSGAYCGKNTDTSVVVADLTKSKETTSAFSGSVDIMIEGKAVNTSELPVFSLNAIAIATNDFCKENELGRGGFGPVYKGVLEDGREIAVKRLSGKSGQGVDEFKNEIILIAKLQHRNLVRLLGCCFEGEEKMLVYEYMPNKSLDFFLFDETKQALIDWKLRFSIIEGIARGLLYLHRDSRLRIIHRDLKVSNVLLDAEMNPKISDFGMARIFGGNQNEANTVRVVGTYGYMSPEYAMEGLFSVKSDVYSFGVLLLEIVSGKRNTSLRSSEHGSLIGYAWYLYTHGRSEELVDPKIRVTCSKREALRCIHVAMLCVQDSAAERPNMASVLLMLESDTATLAAPRQPTFTSTRRNSIDVNFALDNGNFVLRDSKNSAPDGVLWQSFDFPTDTLLPEMKLGWDAKTRFNRFIRSWKSPDDPSSGDFSFKLETEGFPEIFLWNRESRMYRSGPWNGIRFSGVPEMQPFEYMVFNFTTSKEEVTYSFRITKSDVYSRLSISSSGLLQRFTWIETAQNWNQFWYAPKDQCDEYKECGVYGYCDSNTSPVCNCIKGFKPRNPQVWGLRDGSDGCVRKTLLSCGGGDGFVRLKKMKLPDTTTASVDRGIGVKECEQKCLRDCNCTAFANTDIRGSGSGCVTWTGELFDIRNYAKGGQDLYVRLAATDLEDKRNRSAKIIGSSIGVSVLLLLSFIIFFLWKRKQKRSILIETPIVDHQLRSRDLLMNEVVISSRRHISRENNTDDLELPLMEFEEVAMATNNFSNANKLGQGGFGIVYKGKLLDGQEMAVKRLSKTSVQGTDEFKNEVKLIARLQHINLVRLLACCVDAGEKMLIYEYLENLSLDSHLFDKSRNSKLNWQMRFDIINGIARGLLYLHQDSRFRIIHRDLKASNILLDKYMTPKISDFGMARIFGRDETEANTRKVVGTYGYMSPEYAMDGIFSMKSDVFSFGVLLLEIISSKRNKGFYNSDRDLNLLGCVWRNWKEGKGLEIIDPIITDSSSTFRQHEILRCIQIGLLCVQERAEDRPTMSLVILMLGSESTTIPQPKAPGYCLERSLLDTDSSSSKQRDDESWTVNQITVSVLDAR